MKDNDRRYVAHATVFRYTLTRMTRSARAPHKARLLGSITLLNANLPLTAARQRVQSGAMTGGMTEA